MITRSTRGVLTPWRLVKELDLPVAAMLDTKGPEIRLGTFKKRREKLVTGQKFT